jgi:HAD superfamily hydrolase (TIGR01490 family)
MKKFATFDIDGTLIRWQLYHALFNSLTKHGHLDESLYPTIHEARMVWKNRAHEEAFKAYERKMVELYDSSLASLKVEDFEKVIDDVFSEYKDQVYVYTRDLIKNLKQKGYLLFAVSGSQIEIVKKIADYYGFDEYSGSVHLKKDGKFTGESKLPFLNKDKVVKEFAAKHNATYKGSIAVGDSLGDTKMMDIVENPIAFNPERRLFDYAVKKGWKIVVERKNMFYELENRDGNYELVQTSVG